MTTAFQATGGVSLTIPSGTAVSNSLNVQQTVYDAEAFWVMAPAALDALTFTWEASEDGTTWTTLQDSTATDLKVPAAGHSIVYNGMITGMPFLRIKASGNVAADRVFRMHKTVRMPC